MPFQSEKQRRYLWANEPEIARDWTDTYGSGIAKALGGRIGFASGLSLVASLRAMSDKELINWNNDQGGDPNAEKILGERGIQKTGTKEGKATYDYSGSKVKKAGEKYSDVFGGKWETDEDIQQAQDFMRLMENVKRSGDVSGDSLLGGSKIRKLMELDPEGFEEKYGIESGDYEMLDKALGTGWDEARLSNEDYLNQMDERQMTANLPYMKDFKYDANKFKNPIQDPDYNFDFLESMYGNKGITQALTPVDDLEAQNVTPTFEDYEQREEFDERVRNMPIIQDEGIPASERWRNFLSKVTRQPYRPAQYGVTMGSGRTYSPAQLNKMNALGGFYSDPARAARRTKTRGINVLNRAAAEKPVGNVNQLLGQYGYEATPGGGLAFTGTPEGDPTAGAGYSRSDDSWSSSTFNRGGLADLWRR
jgi:hypothetical protein